MPALTEVAGRLARALQNFGETFPLFAAGVLIHAAASQLDDRVGCSALFLGSCRLSSLICSRGFSLALSGMECSGARNPLGPSVADLSMTRPSALRFGAGRACVRGSLARAGIPTFARRGEVIFFRGDPDFWHLAIYARLI